MSCELDADPPEVVFQWTFNNSAGGDPARFSVASNGRRSVATVTSFGGTDDTYGILKCRGQNRVGVQLEPCIFFLVQSRKPDKVDNCSVTNATTSSLTLECLPGFNGGLSQVFHLEVLSEGSPQQVRQNLTAKEYPIFVVSSLPAGVSLRLVVYSSNEKGNSERQTIKSNTLLASKLSGTQSRFGFVTQLLNCSSIRFYTDDRDQLVFNPSVAFLFLIISALAVTTVTAIVIMKTRSSRNCGPRGEIGRHA